MPRDKGLRFRGFVIPESELVWSFDTSGGPGGQHANRTSSRATLTLDVARSTAFPEPTRHHILMRLDRKARDGVVTVVCDDTRSQWRNRAIARQRLIDILESAMAPEQSRRRTKPSRSARRRRLQNKRHRGETKRLRRQPESEE